MGFTDQHSQPEEAFGFAIVTGSRTLFYLPLLFEAV
jgi:hypothetical protein